MVNIVDTSMAFFSVGLNVVLILILTLLLVILLMLSILITKFFTNTQAEIQ